MGFMENFNLPQICQQLYLLVFEINLTNAKKILRKDSFSKSY